MSNMIEPKDRNVPQTSRAVRRFTKRRRRKIPASPISFLSQSEDNRTCLREERYNNCTVRELPASQGAQCFLCRLGVSIFDKNLADTWIDARSAGSGDLERQYLSE